MRSANNTNRLIIEVLRSSRTMLVSIVWTKLWPSLNKLELELSISHHTPLTLPIECFSIDKAYLRANDPLLQVLEGSEIDAILSPFASVVPSDCYGWVKDCGYTQRLSILLFVCYCLVIFPIIYWVQGCFSKHKLFSLQILLVQALLIGEAPPATPSIAQKDERVSQEIWVQVPKQNCFL